MCRWVAYHGKPVFLEDFVTTPRLSLVAQSRQCREARSEINADGFGVGWFGERNRPGVFRDIRPAWSDENLASLAHQIRSGLFLAHVRASTGTATTRANCHPFSVGQWIFMHNGQIGGWERLRRRIEMRIPDDLFLHRGGTTDSEAIFLLLMAHGLDEDPEGACRAVLAFVGEEMVRANVTEPMKFTAAFANGRTLYAIRFATDGVPPTLYTRHCPDSDGIVVVSEPLDEMRDGWQAVPPQTLLKVEAGGITSMPFAIPALQPSTSAAA
jgi:glutamine amidotransferase